MDTISASIISAVTAGASKLKDIAAKTGLSGEALDKPLQRLRKTGVLAFVKGGVGWVYNKTAEPITEAAEYAEVQADAKPEPKRTRKPSSRLTNREVEEIAAGGPEPKPAKKGAKLYIVPRPEPEDFKTAEPESEDVVIPPKSRQTVAPVLYVWDADAGIWDAVMLGGAADADTIIADYATKGRVAIKGDLNAGAPADGPSEEALTTVTQTAMLSEGERQSAEVERHLQASAETTRSINERAAAAAAIINNKPAKAKKAAPAAKPEPTEVEPQDFLLFVGGNYYKTADDFINEAQVQGISRRMPTHRLPKGLIVGKSKVFLAFGGLRAAGTEDNVSEVFGYFVPTAIEFIRSTKGKGKGEGDYTDIIGSLKGRDGVNIIDSIKTESERGCGVRKEGGTYIVSTTDCPLVKVKPAKFIGNHFRGLMKLDADQSKAMNSGGEVAVLITETCMVEGCGATFKCAPDGHIRAERERRRMEKGHPAKWLLKCGKCRKDHAAHLADERRAAAAEEAGEVIDDEEGEAQTDAA